MKVLIVDDHAIILQGLARVIADEFPGTVFGEARSYQHALNELPRQRWDIAILDIDLPGRSGLQLLTQVKLLYPKLPVLMFSMHSEDQFAVRSLKAGASGYVSKDSPSADLLTAIGKVVRGGRYVSPRLAERMAAELNHDGPHELHHLLSDREFEVMRMIAQGKTTSAIGELLALSVKTVSTYRTRILEKLGLESNAELIRYAIDLGLDRS